jgi:hypothetical protein
MRAAHMRYSAAGAYAVVLGSAAVTAAVLAVFCSTRGLDGDEGFYLSAGRHVFEGRRLYADVFYPQMPYLPWAESVAFHVFGVSLWTGRALSIGAAALAAAILTTVVWQVERSLGAAVIAAYLALAHGVSLHMLALAKTYGLGNLCLLAAYAPFALGRSHHSAWALAAGAAAGCAVGVRLPAAAAAVVLAALAWNAGRRPFLAFGAGAILGSFGWLMAAVQAPDQFWFCNVGFHSLRREVVGFVPIAAQKAGVIAKWVFWPQHIILWFLVAVALWRGPRRWGPVACLIALAAAYAAATPTYLQYIVQLIPFALLAAGPALVWLWSKRWPALAVLALYLVALYPSVSHVPRDVGLGLKRRLWDLATVSDVVQFVQARTGPEDSLLSWWEGYPVLAGRPGFIGVGFWEANVAKKIDAASARRYHVMRQEDVGALIRDRVPAAIVTTTDNWRNHRDAIDAGYLLAHQAASIEVYLRRDL